MASSYTCVEQTGQILDPFLEFRVRVIYMFKPSDL